MSNLEVFIWLFIVQEQISTSFRNDLLKARSKCDWKLTDRRFVLLRVCHYLGLFLEDFSSHFTCNTASWLIARPRVINSCYWPIKKTRDSVPEGSITRINYPWPWDKPGCCVACETQRETLQKQPEITTNPKQCKSPIHQLPIRFTSCLQQIIPKACNCVFLDNE